MKHINEWLKDRIYGGCTEDEKYAVAFFILIGMNAVYSFAINPIMTDHKLFCIYKGKKYRVTGRSNMGDIWLVIDHSRDCGYDLRVDVEDCNEWGKEC